MLERFPVGWNRERFHPTGNARTGVAGFTAHIPFGWFQPNGMCFRGTLVRAASGIVLRKRP